jgi:membrane fusion protein (multidrug efflux system)
MNVLTETKPAVTQAASLPRAKRRRRWPLRLLLPAALLGLGLVANWWFQVGRHMESTDNAYVQGDMAVLSPRIDGFVAAILVQDNQRVSAGDPLIALDPALWQAQLLQAEAAEAEAAAAIGTLREQLEQQQAQAGASEALLAQARAELVRAVADSRRYDSLAGTGVASRQTTERAIADRAKAEAGVNVARANLSVTRQQAEVVEAQLRQAEAHRAQAAATVARARLDVENCVLRAPFDGLVGNRAAQLGQYVRSGQQLIAVAPPPERQWVVANFKETQLAHFRAGLPVRLRFDALPDVVLAARIDSLAPATGALFSLLPPENATGNFTKIVQRVPVRLTLPAGAGALAPPAAAGSLAPPAAAGSLALLRPGLSALAEVDTRADPTAPRSLFGALGTTLRQIF